MGGGGGPIKINPQELWFSAKRKRKYYYGVDDKQRYASRDILLTNALTGRLSQLLFKYLSFNYRKPSKRNLGRLLSGKDSAYLYNIQYSDKS